MCRRTELAAVLLGCCAPAFAAGIHPGIGRAATPAEIRAWDIDVRPDFQGLPPGSGSVARGQRIWDAKCTSCHGTFGESNEVFPPLVGGTTADDIRTGHVKALRSPDVARTTLMKVPTVSTLWDYVRRAMPWDAPKSLSVDEVYAVVAYLLNLGDILPDDFVLSDRNIAQVQERMPNRNGMTLAHGLGGVRGKPDVHNVACMKDCPVEARLASMLPDYAAGAHGDIAAQNRPIGGLSSPARSAPVPAPSESAALTLARRNACLSCHQPDRRIVGPAFREVAAKYKGVEGAEARLVEKVRRGGSGNWGPLAMPPHPDLAQDDLVTLVRWVLAGAL